MNGRKAVFVLLSLVVAIFLLGCGKDAWHPKDEFGKGDFRYEEVDGGLEIVDYTGSATSITIPREIYGMPVVAIGNSAFSKSRLDFLDNKVAGTITDIIIPNSVRSIGDAAFDGNQLTSVIIPNSVYFIGRHAFQNNQLTSVTISNIVSSIEDYAFETNQLTSVIIPNSVFLIGIGAFARNPLLTSVTIGAGIEIRPGAFSGNFIEVYWASSRSAGTYIRTGNTWSKQ